MPGFLGTEKEFNSKYSRPIQSSRNSKTNSKEQVDATLALQNLHLQVLPFLLRRVKEDVLNDLPNKIIILNFQLFKQNCMKTFQNNRFQKQLQIKKH
jgi:SNF2 family DNA or RNA helicase